MKSPYSNFSERSTLADVKKSNKSTIPDEIEQRGRESEKRSIRENRDTDDTDDTDEVSPSGACVGTLQKAAEMALADNSPGDVVFRFARAVKAFELNTDKRLPKNELPAAFEIWWIKAKPTLPPDTDREECLLLFLDAYDKAKTPLGSNAIENAVKSVDTSAPPPEAERYASPRMKRLVHLCHALQRIAGDASFFLSVRDAARAIGLSAKSLFMVSAFLHGLERDEVLKPVKRGKAGGQKATRYRYVRHEH